MTNHCLTHPINMVKRIARLMLAPVGGDARGRLEVQVTFGIHHAAILEAILDVAIPLHKQ